MDKINYLKVRKKTVDICRSLNEDEVSCQPVKEVSPPKWHLAHTTWFFEKVILSKKLESYKPFNLEYDFYFNSYYKQGGKHIEQSQRGGIKVSVQEIQRYRQYVDKHMEELFECEVSKDLSDLILIGLHHEQQHQEILHMDIKAIKNFYGKNTEIVFPEAIKNKKWFQIPEGIHECGHQGESFAYDNEKPRHKSYIYSSLLKEELVRNIEYSEFINAGGYKDSKFWLSKGWEWVVSNEVSAPLYWNESLKPDAPVAHMSYFEAEAFARWSGFRLPTEFELEVFDQHKSCESPLWCWSSSQYEPYPRFKKLDGLLSEYNGKFMCNQFILRGGCFATPKNHWRPSYRNFYEPHQRWMFSGIRLAKDVQ